MREVARFKLGDGCLARQRLLGRVEGGLGYLNRMLVCLEGVFGDLRPGRVGSFEHQIMVEVVAAIHSWLPRCVHFPNRLLWDGRDLGRELRNWFIDWLLDRNRNPDPSNFFPGAELLHFVKGRSLIETWDLLGFKLHEIRFDG